MLCKEYASDIEPLPSCVRETPSRARREPSPCKKGDNLRQSVTKIVTLVGVGVDAFESWYNFCL